MHLEVSIVVCTYNRARLLRQSLESLCRQTADGEQYEIVAVDNNSFDETPATVEQVVSLFPDRNIRYVREQRQGLSHARNRGMREARAPWVGYVDDDARVPQEFVQRVVQLARTVPAHTVCFGGPYRPFYTSPTPNWFDDEWESWGRSYTKGYLSDGSSLRGSNMFWRSQVAAELGGFDPELGMCGEHLGVGEETELFHRLWRSSAACSQAVYFAPELEIEHWVPPHKMTLRYRLSRWLVSGATDARRLAQRRSGPVRLTRGLLFPIVSVVLISVSIFKAIKARPLRSHLVAALAPATKEIGIGLVHLGLWTQKPERGVHVSRPGKADAENE